MPTIHSPFLSHLIASNFSSILTVFLWFFIWTALGDVDLCSSLILVTKAYAVEQGATSAMRFYHQCNQSIHMADGVTAMSLSASLQDKTVPPGIILSNCVQLKTITDCLCQIALNGKLSCTFEKWCKFSSCIWVKSRKNKLHKMRPAYIFVGSSLN